MGEDKFPDLERRKSPRLKSNIFIHGCLRANPIKELKAFTNDISAGGLMFETERDIPQDSNLELELYQPMNRARRIIFFLPVLVKVIWTKGIEKDEFEKGENKYKIGVQFTEIKEGDREIIAKYVEENLSRVKK